MCVGREKFHSRLELLQSDGNLPAPTGRPNAGELPPVHCCPPASLVASQGDEAGVPFCLLIVFVEGSSIFFEKTSSGSKAVRRSSILV